MKRFSLLLLLAIVLLQNARAQSSSKHFDRDKQTEISKIAFDNLVDSCTHLLETHNLPSIPDSGHIHIMMCLNTIMMSEILVRRGIAERFSGKRYEQFQEQVNRTDYCRKILTVYPDHTYNRGMGFYFPSLGMELYGTPMLYAWYNVKD